MALLHENSALGQIKVGSEKEILVKNWISGQSSETTVESGVITQEGKRELEGNLNLILEGALKQKSKRENVKARKEATENARKALALTMSKGELTDEQLKRLEDEILRLAAGIKARRDSQGMLDSVANQIMEFFLKLFGREITPPEKDLEHSSRLLRKARTILQVKQEASQEVPKLLIEEGENEAVTAEDQIKYEALYIKHYVLDAQESIIEELKTRIGLLKKAIKSNKQQSASKEKESLEEYLKIASQQLREEKQLKKALNTLIKNYEKTHPSLSAHTRIAFTMPDGKKIDSLIPIRSFQEQLNMQGEGAKKIIEERKRILEKLWEKYGIKKEEREEFGRKFQEALEVLKKQEKPEVPRVENYEDPEIKELKGRIKLLESMSESQLQQQGIENPKGALTEAKKQLKEKEKQLTIIKEERARIIGTFGLKELVQQGDGHCFYRTLTHALTGKNPPKINTGNAPHMKLRKAICAYAWENRTDWMAFFECTSEKQFREKLKVNATTREWADDKEMFILENMFDVRVNIYDINRNNSLLTPRVRGGDVFETDKPVITALFTGNHYNLLVATDKQIDTNGNFAPEVQVDFDGIVNEHIRKGEEAGLFKKARNSKVKRSK